MRQHSIRDRYRQRPPTPLQRRDVAARKLLQAFLTNARRERWHCLRIIHGKGLSSERGESVLRPLVAHLLSLRGDVLAFASAPQNQGGGGATLVLLQSRPRRAG
ncbi:MAG: Smr/MutS family protein [Xanthomonadaceae bacterium]|nr:Smr/MutS family protein [Xanthomonadaceae bacterium]MDP2186465.1 Smr/MutS family protein [Xanthomonadales bacterium]MDZ4117385.1 Smr/MutS family protein [Xanthomonadaceae bacterium]MDZ4379589.1 Smr/MutS family protein [Xanthomonadaceae bacterium]